MAESRLLGDYLQARRALVTPEQVGLPRTRGRRAPGLRREEVAILAGISVDYYLRLEKGRDTNPSPQVLTALARVLQLDPVATDHLLGLAVAQQATRAPAHWRDEEVPEGTRVLLGALDLPAFVENRAFDVLAANERAAALSPAIRPGANRLVSMFLDGSERALHPDWERESAAMVAEFRASIGAALHDPHVRALVDELAADGGAFRQAWDRHDVDLLVGAAVRWQHPEVGLLSLRRGNYGVNGTGGQHLVVYYAAPGSDDARRLALLGRPGAQRGDRQDPE